MKKRISVMCMTLALALAMPGLAYAQYDFDALLDSLPGRLEVATVNNWANNAQIWQLVQPNPSGSAAWGQLSPTFRNQDHTGDGIKDDDHLALLAKVLNDDACTRALLGDAKMNQIQAAFAANKARVQDFEMTLRLQVYDTSRVNLRYATGIFLLGTITRSNVGVRMSATNITTGGSQQLPLEADLLGWIGLGSLIGDIDIPSLWGDGGVLSAVEDGFEEDVANLLAAYLTMGDQASVDYMQALLSQVIAKGVLPNIMLIVLQAIGKNNEALDIDWVIEPQFVLALDEKNYDLPAQPNIVFDQVFTAPYERIDLGDGNWIEIVRLNGIITNVESNLEAWIHNYVVNANGFTSYPAWLAASGNLNGSGFTNALSYSTYGGNRTSFLISESTAYPAVSFGPQPVGTSSATYGAANWNFGAGLQLTPSGIAGVTVPTQYQWQWNNGGTWENISGAITLGWTLPLDYIGTRQYRVIVTPPVAQCASPVTSATASVKVDPPAIAITQHPVGADLYYGQDLSLSVSANIAVGGLNYQWRRNSINVGGNSPNYMVSGVTFTDAGFYDCVISSDTFVPPLNPTVLQATSNSANVTVSNPPIEITLQPVGVTIPENDPFTLETAAQIFNGTVQYQWQRKISGAWNNISTGSVYSVLNAQSSDQGEYRCMITTASYPGVPPSYTSNVYVKVGLGSVYLVDKLSPADPGTEDGLTWDTAFKTIQEGIDAAFGDGGGEVWVAGGPYPGGYVYDEVRTEPWGDPSVTGSLVLKDNVEVYGGFEGYWGFQESARDQRGVRNVVTIIDGSVSRAGAPAYHVVVIGKAASGTEGARLDGFDIRGGNAVGMAAPYGYHTYRGGGLFNWISSPVIANCTFYANAAAVSGGAVANEGNTDVALDQPQPQFINCVFFNNHAERLPDAASPTPNPIRGGGAIFNARSNAKLAHCTIVGNTIGTPGYTDFGAAGGGVYSWDSSLVQVNDSILWGNPQGDIQRQGPGQMDSLATAADYSNIGVTPGPVSGTGNISADPQFLLPAGPEFHLNPATSPCVDTGNPIPSVDRDLPGAPRPLGLMVDMGAYEHVPGLPTALCQNATVQLDASGEAIVSAAMVQGAGIPIPLGGLWGFKVDNGGALANQVVLGCAELGDTPVTLSVIDFHGQIATCIATVTVEDEVSPTAVCPSTAITVQLDGTGNASIVAADVDGGSTDNCAIDWPSSTVVPNTFTCANIGTPVVVTLTVFDESGNSDTCLAQVIVEDEVPPVVTTKDIIVDLDEFGDASIVVADVDDGTADNCDAAPVLELDITEFTCADLGPNTVTLTATDTYGNSDTGTATVTVNDVTPAEITLTGAAFVVVPLNGTYNELGAVAQDACDGTQAALVGGDTVLTDTTGFYTVTYDYTDSSSNVSTQVTRTVRVVPVPVITILGPNPAGPLECSVDTYTEPVPAATAWDEIDGDLTDDIDVSGLPVSTSGTGLYPVTYTVTNSLGQTGQAVRIVEVTDTIPPTFGISGTNPQYVVKGSTTWTEPGISASDECDGMLVGANLVLDGDYPVDTSVTGTSVVSYDLSDSSGNAAPTQYLTVHVIDALLQFTEQPQDALAYVDDDPFDLSAAFTGGFNPATYQWIRVKGSTSTPLGAQPITDNTIYVSVDPAAIGVGAYRYFAQVTDAMGTITSAPANVTIGAHMSLTDDIEDDTVLTNSEYSMGITVVGGLGTIRYAWYKDDGAKAMQPLSDTLNITGTDTNTLTFQSFSAADEGYYQVIATDQNGFGEDLPSSIARLTAATGVPVAGVFGLAMLAALSAAGGAVTLRRRNRR